MTFSAVKSVVIGTICAINLCSNAFAACLTQAQAQSAINAKHQQNLSLLGNPVGGLQTIGSTGNGSMLSGWRQAYQNQDNAVILISECGNTGAHIVQGYIRMQYDKIKAAQPLGFPISDELAFSNQYFHGRESKFERGFILYKTGSTPFVGTFPIFSQTVYMNSNLIAELTERNQEGGKFNVISQGNKPGSSVDLYANTWMGQIKLQTKQANGQGIAQFQVNMSNNYAGAGNSQSFIFTFESTDNNGNEAATAVRN